LHFGLGTATTVDQIEIRWPDRTVQRAELPGKVDRYYVIEEGKAPVPQP
jgi:enediyne biosynthesis protein E4